MLGSHAIRTVDLLAQVTVDRQSCANTFNRAFSVLRRVCRVNRNCRIGLQRRVRL